MNYELRKTWDNYADNMVTLDSDQETGSKLIHWVMKYPVIIIIIIILLLLLLFNKYLLLLLIIIIIAVS